jgi:hypothetical protein
MTGVGPFDLEPNESVTVAFAVIGANSISDLETSADQVQALWDGVTGIEEIGINPEEFDLQVFPNPVKDHLTLTFNLVQGRNIGLRILNINGQVQMVETAKDYPAGVQQLNADLSDLPSGTYLMQLDIDGKAVTKKIIVD